jgi:hypothetical protein
MLAGMPSRTRADVKRLGVVVVVLLLLPSESAAIQTVHINTASVGPAFDGLGGCSAGTGPRLLVDYPEPARSTLLDYLFLPNHGASLDIIKLEIGGQGDSTTGTESTHEPRPGVFDFHSGYEWFMMTEAVKRNPNITVYGLPWSFPSWLYSGTNHTACGQDWVGCVNGSKAAAYIAEWAAGAKRVHGVHVSYIGWHNESPWRPEWTVLLRAELDERGLLATQIVVGDCGPGDGFQSPGLAAKLLPNASVDISQVADVVGLHYPVSIMPVAHEPSNAASQYYKELWDLPGKQKLWASEDYSTYSDSNGGRCLAKLVNRNYVDANLTALIVWDMVWAWMDGLACSGQGLIWAGEPWSGAVGLVDTVWAIAHTTQVTQPGWRLLKKAGPWGSGGAGYLPPATGGHPTPPPTHCPPSTWPANASGWQCDGLGNIPTADSSAVECAVHCCNDPHCATWQWAPAGKSPAGDGCWTGGQPVEPASCNKDPAWVGGSRVAPLPPPPPPAPPPSVGGTYVGYVSSSSANADVSLVIETMNNLDSQCSYGNGGWGEVPKQDNQVEFCLSSSVCVAHRQLFFTHSMMGVPEGTRFEPLPPIELPTIELPTRVDADACCFEIVLKQNSIYSLSTKNTAKKGKVPAETTLAHAPEGVANGCGTFPTPITTTTFPIGYSTNFSLASVRFNDFAEFLSDIQGVFRVRIDPFDGSAAGADAPSSSHVLSQLTVEPRLVDHTGPNGWNQLPMTLLGSKNWSDFTVRAVGRTNGTGKVGVAANETIAVYGRCGHGYAFSAAGGYCLQLWPASNKWTLTTGPTHDALLAHGVCAGCSPGWTELTVSMTGSTITAHINGMLVANVTDATYSKGMAGLGSGWHPAWFRNFGVSHSHLL